MSIGPLQFLLVEAVADDALRVQELLAHGGFGTSSCTWVRTLDEALTVLSAADFDVVFLDLLLPDATGLELLDAVSTAARSIPVIILTSTDDQETGIAAVKRGAQDYLVKDRLDAQVVGRAAAYAVERQLISTALRETSERVRVALRASLILVFNHDMELRYTWVDRRQAWLDSADAVGRTDLDMLPRGEAVQFMKVKQLVLDTGYGTRREFLLTVHGEQRCFDVTIEPLRDLRDHMVGLTCAAVDITERKAAETEREQLIEDLQRALAEVKRLSGLLPICAGCKRVRDDTGYWNEVEQYISAHTDAEFTHSLCPDCIAKLDPTYKGATASDEKGRDQA